MKYNKAALRDLKNHPIDSEYSADIQKAQIESIFSCCGITDPTVKKQHLIKAKGLLSFYSQAYKRLTPEQQYQHELELYINGKGRKLKQIYSKIDV